MNHKIICWGDYGIPVSENMNWLAMDDNGSWYVYSDKPRINPIGFWASSGELERIANGEMLISPPEPGAWRSQLYWIGD